MTIPARRRWIAGGPLLLALLAPAAATAEPTPPPATPPFQLSTSLLVGGGVQRVSEADRRKAVFFLGARADLDPLRAGPKSVGLGPYVELGSVAFRSFEAGAGLNLTVPVGSPALQLAAGPHLRWDDGGRHLGVTATALFGSRSFNYHSKYGFAAGGFLQGRFAVDGSPQRDVILGAQIDFELLALPALLVGGSIRHGTP